MREIKFRGKRLDNGEWVYGVADGMVGGWDIDPATVGQFTGLQDKNGVEIYEGDILNYKTYSGGVLWCLPLVYRDENAAEVVFEDGSFRSKTCGSPIHELVRPFCNNEKTKYEVIGNAHQHPDLLEACGRDS